MVQEFTGLLKTYRIRRIVGDRYAGEWPIEAFRKAGITYETSERTKSQIYTEALPLLNAGRVELLDHPRLVAQLCASKGGPHAVDVIQSTMHQADMTMWLTSRLAPSFLRLAALARRTRSLPGHGSMLVRRSCPVLVTS